MRRRLVGAVGGLALGAAACRSDVARKGQWLPTEAEMEALRRESAGKPPPPLAPPLTNEEMRVRYRPLLPPSGR
jgi:hypothetical protein